MNVVIVAQAGRLAIQALLFAETYRRSGSGARNPLYVAVPEPGPLWVSDPRPDARYLARYRELGAHLISFENRDFGSRSGFTNKIYALFALPAREPFLFLDSDQLILSSLDDIELDFDHPSARLAENPWPPRGSITPAPEVWRKVYELTGATMERQGSRRYFNAGCYYYVDPHRFGELMLDACLKLVATREPAIAGQPLLPFPVDQVALSAVVERIGEGRDCPDQLNSIALNETTVSWHYHRFSRFWMPGNERAGALVDSVLGEQSTRSLAMENETLAFLTTDLGRQVIAKADQFVRRHRAKLNMRDAGKLLRILGFD